MRLFFPLCKILRCLLFCFARFLHLSPFQQFSVSNYGTLEAAEAASEPKAAVIFYVRTECTNPDDIDENGGLMALKVKIRPNRGMKSEKLWYRECELGWETERKLRREREWEM